MQSPVDQIKERLAIAEVVGSYVKLERAGANLKARCPFHNEKTPSFFVSPARGSYHCFGCNRGGDMFTFVEEIEGVSFSDALKMLAERAGVALRVADPKQKSEYDKLHALLEAATVYYEGNLKENNEALLYLKGRGLSDETISRWRLGLAPDGWSGLYDNLRKKGFSDAEIDKAGLTVMGQRGYYDRFRSRIMFPLSNQSGKVVGFSGRIFMPYQKEKEKELAKYVNSPDTVLYNKSRLLYGYDKAKSAMLRENSAVLVEGQMDLLMSHQAGFENTVALSGTALTEEHVKLVKRLADNLVLALDSDAAGLAASERSWRMATALGLEVKVAKLPEGLDPAEFIKKDKAQFAEALKNARHIILYLLELLRLRNLDQRTMRLEAGKRILPYVVEISNRIDQAHFVETLARELSLDEEHIWEEIRKIKSRPDSSYLPPAGETKPGLRRRDVIARKIIGLILWQDSVKEPAVDAKKARAEYEKFSEEYGLPAAAEIKNKEDLVFESEVYYAHQEHLDRELSELFRNLERELLEEKFAEMMRELSAAENKSETARAAELLKKCQDISKRINKIKMITPSY